MASVRCVDGALGFTGTVEGMAAVGTGAMQIPVQGNHMRNIIEGADLVMSHILHFYHLAALDYINTSGTPIDGQAPWSPKDNTADMITGTLATALVLQYVTALDIRREVHRMGAYASGKQPCTPSLIPGGVTKTVPAGSTMVSDMSTILTGVRNFIDNTYIPTVVVAAKALSGSLLVGTDAQGVGRGCKKFLAYGTFPTSSGTQALTGGFVNATGAWPWSVAPLNPAYIKEHITYSYYDAGTLSIYDRLHPSVGVTKPQFGKTGAYSWLKAPRYETTSASADCHVCEVGPLARMVVNTVAGVAPWAGLVTNFITTTLGLPLTTGVTNLPSVLGRHAARALEAKGIADLMPTWLAAVGATTATGQSYNHRNIPTTSSSGYGLTEAPRGALGHWIRVDGGKVSNYQCVVPTTWNAGPKDLFDQHGTIEQAIMGTQVQDDAAGRVAIGRIIRSFDPCIACAVHIVSADKKTISKWEVVPQGVVACK
jgi:hydrogenase large subunit